MDTGETSQSKDKVAAKVSAKRLRNTRIILISWVAGSIDALSYLGLGHVFTANMTGNTVLLAITLGTHTAGLSIIRSADSLGTFLVGALVGTIVVSIRLENRRETERKNVTNSEALEQYYAKEEWPVEVNLAIVLEAFILLAFGLIWMALPPNANYISLYVLIALAALAMGIQSIAISYLGIWGIVTTYITGTYTSFLVGIIRKISGRQVSNATTIHQASSATGQEKSPVTRGQRSLSLEAYALISYGFGAGLAGYVLVRNFELSPWMSITAIFIVALLSFIV